METHEENSEPCFSNEPSPGASKPGRTKGKELLAAWPVLVAFATAIVIVCTVLAFVIPFVKEAAKNMAGNIQGGGDRVLVLFAGAFVLLAVVDHLYLLCRPRRPSPETSKPVWGGATSGPVEFCPTCGEKLDRGICPNGHTIIRCGMCGSIMKDGVCPRCGMDGEPEICPACGTELVNGECHRGHTIIRCSDCGSILREGVCPKGCNADPLNLSWPGGVERRLGAFALKVVSCIKSKGVGFELRVPDSFIVGRSSAYTKEPFVELLTVTCKEKAQCSRQYVRMELDPTGGGFVVTLLNDSRNPAFVDGEKLFMQNDTARLPLGGRIKLNPGYELELVKAADETDSPST